MHHNMKLKNTPFEKIKNGKKTMELRLYDEKRKLLNIGDTITFTNMENSEELTVKVIGLHRFDSFKDLYNNIDKKLIGYDENEVVDPNHMNEYYSIEEQKKYGVLAIEIELIKGDEKNGC